MATASMKFENYCPEEENFETYCERLVQILYCGQYNPGENQSCYFIEQYGLKVVFNTERLSGTKQSECVKIWWIMSNNERLYYTPEKPTLAHRYAFYRRRQQHSGETVTNFMTALKKQAEKCKFGIMRETMIRDMLVCRLRDRGTQLRLFAKSDDLTLEKAEKIALSMEMRPRFVSLEMEETRRFATRDMDKMSFNVIAVEVTTTRRILASIRTINVTYAMLQDTWRKCVKTWTQGKGRTKRKDKNDRSRGESKSKHGKPKRKTKGKHKYKNKISSRVHNVSESEREDNEDSECASDSDSDYGIHYTQVMKVDNSQDANQSQQL